MANPFLDILHKLLGGDTTQLKADAGLSMSTATNALDDALEQQRKAREKLEQAAVPVADREDVRRAAEARQKTLQQLGFRYGEPLGQAPVGYTTLTGQV